MEEPGSIWRGASCDAGLSGADTRALERACRRDPALADELDFLVAHLNANLGATFLRAFAVQLHGGTQREDALIAALSKTIRATPWPSPRRRASQ